MQIPGTAFQIARHLMFDASGTSTGAAQAVLPEAKSRSLLFIQNISDTNMFIQIGCAFATATISGGQVTSIAVVNAGFGFTYGPTIELLGGGPVKPDGRTPNLTSVAVGQPGYDAPGSVATAHCVLSSGAISSIVVDDPGSGYTAAPYVQVRNMLRDPVGAADPSGSTGFLLPANGGNITFNGSSCPTDPVALFCTAGGKKFTCKYMT